MFSSVNSKLNQELELIQSTYSIYPREAKATDVDIEMARPAYNCD